MDWATTLQDAGVIAAASTAIFFVIDFIKKLYYKLPWGWIQKTPGEVWFALSIAFGLGIALILFWDSFFGTDASVSSGLASAAYGLVSGAGSKFINSIASSAGAKLQASKEEAKAKTVAITNGKKEEVKVPEPKIEPVPENPTETTLGGTVQTPVYNEETSTPSLQGRVEEMKDKIEDRLRKSVYVIAPDGKVTEFDYIPTEAEIKAQFPTKPIVEVVKKVVPLHRVLRVGALLAHVVDCLVVVGVHHEPVGLGDGDHTEVGEAGDILGVDELQVGDHVAGIACPVLGAGIGEAVQGDAGGGVADGVDVDLHAGPIEGGAHLVVVLGIPQQLAVARLVQVGLLEVGGPAFQDAVHEDLGGHDLEEPAGLGGVRLARASTAERSSSGPMSTAVGKRIVIFPEASKSWRACRAAASPPGRLGM